MEVSPRIGFKQRDHYPLCTPPNITLEECDSWGLQMWSWFAESMWPKGVDYIVFDQDNRGNAGSNETETIYGALSAGQLDAYSSFHGITEKRLKLYSFSIPLALSETYFYYSKSLLRKSKHPLTEFILNKFAPLSKEIWITATILHWILMLLLHFLAKDKRFARLFALLIGTVVRMYRLNLSAMIMAPLPPKEPFSSYEELAQLIDAGELKLASAKDNNIEDIFGDDYNGVTHPLMKALERHPVVNISKDCREMYSDKRLIMLRSSTSLLGACPLDCFHVARWSRVASVMKAVLFRKHFPELNRANWVIPYIQAREADHRRRLQTLVPPKECEQVQAYDENGDDHHPIRVFSASLLIWVLGYAFSIAVFCLEILSTRLFRYSIQHAF